MVLTYDAYSETLESLEAEGREADGNGRQIQYNAITIANINYGTWRHKIPKSNKSDCLDAIQIWNIE